MGHLGRCSTPRRRGVWGRSWHSSRPSAGRQKILWLLPKDHILMHDLRELHRCIADVVACHIVLRLDEDRSEFVPRHPCDNLRVGREVASASPHVADTRGRRCSKIRLYTCPEQFPRYRLFPHGPRSGNERMLPCERVLGGSSLTRSVTAS
jgi:hypothetical protein